MAGWRRAGRSWARRLGVLAAVAALLGGVAQAPGQAAAAGHPGAPPLPKVKAAAGVGRLGVRKIAAVRAMPAYRPRETGWPAAAQAGITLRAAAAPLSPAGQAAQRALGSQGLVARGAGTPVWAQPLPGHTAMSGLRVQVLSHAAALAAGVHGVVFIARPAAGSAGGPVRLGVSYAGFAQVSGGNYGLGLGLAELPACALTTPGRPACRVERPLASRNDPAGQDVSAQVSLPAVGAASGSAAAGVVLAATTTSDGGGPAGTYSATSLRASGTWSQGGSSGAFTYSYPLTVPPAARGLVPSVGLDYDSGQVDGQTAAPRRKASWAGDGWSAPEAFIEQSFMPCADNPEGGARRSPPRMTAMAGRCSPVPGRASNPLVCPVPFSYTTTSHVRPPMTAGRSSRTW